MDRNKKVRINEWIFIVIAWIFLMNLYSWFMMSNFELLVNAADIEKIIRSNIITNYMYSGYQYLESTLFGLIFGFAFALFNHFSYPTVFKKHSFGHVIIVQSVFYLLAMILTGLIIYGIMSKMNILPDEYLTTEVFRFLTVESTVSIAVFLVGTIVLINFVLQVNRKFGPGNLLSMILGKYATPKEEQRIFMFLDLNDSTTHAERLGHLKYSELIQNCYRELTNIVLKYDAEIYQYVGDEVVLCWTISRGLDQANCIKTYFAYEKALNNKADYYQSKFGVIPQFKAGMDMGTVTVIELGEIKREIAYHGDVLNTASRIQHLCKKLHYKLIISEKIATFINLGNRFTKKSIGNINLRGKNSAIGLYGITYNQ